ncbi:MAG: hypothetical protein LUD12_04240 [Lachnospiraceae bacterium]|nr:hypothetical protein [Lachnospiraceae bacterium]
MKLKRTKLAALALTALMAVGATSLVAYAGETDEPAVAATYYTFEDISFASDGTVTLTYLGDDNTTKTETATATVYKTTAADCGNDGTTIYSYTTTIDGTAKTYYSEAFVTSKATGDHTYVTTKTVTVAATHDTDGELTVTKKCSVCGKTETTTETLDATGHEKSSAVTYELIPAGTYLSDYKVTVTGTGNIKTESGKIVYGSDGLPQASDVTADAYYYKVTECTEYDTDGYLFYEVVQIPASTVSYAKVTYQSDTIKTDLAALVGTVSSVNLGSTFPIAESKIEMTNCSKTGYYVVTYYATGGAVISTQTFNVSAHHMEVVLVEFASANDQAQCTVTYKSDGSYTIVNNSCSETITYYEVTHCAAAGCTEATCTSKYVEANGYTHSSLTKISSVTKTVAPTGAHSIDETAKSAITASVKAGTTYWDLYQAYKDNSYIKFANNTSTCTVAGTVDVQYVCKICGAVVETETVEVKAPEHENAVAVTEDYVAPTCSSTGSYNAVVYCLHKDLYGCDYVDSTTKVLIPRTKHTNETSVTTSGVGTEDTTDSLKASNVGIQFVGDVVVDPGDGIYLDLVGETLTLANTGYDVTSTKYDGTARAHIGGGTGTTLYPTSLGVYAYAASYCDVCGYEVAIDKVVSLKITSITQEKSNGEAGSITIEATYYRAADKKTVTATYTCDYYSTLAAYYGRTETTPISGLHLDDDGVYRYYVNNAVDYTYSGIVTYQGGQFFVANGVLCSDANGLNLYDGTWYFLSQGQVQTQYTGFAEYDGSYFYIVKGVLSTVVNGLVEYDGSKFLVAEGRLINTYNGLYQDFDGDWYFLANGQLQDYTGVAMYDGAFFKLVNGVLDSTFNGTIEYDGATFNVVAGQLYDQVA